MLFRHRSSLFLTLGVLFIFWVLLRDNGKIVSRVVEPFQWSEWADTPKGTHFDQAQVHSSPNDISPPSNLEAPKPQDVLYPPEPSPTHMNTLVHPSSAFLTSKPPQEPTVTTTVPTQTATSKDYFQAEYKNLEL
jgi:hypothetical protein